VAPIPGKAAVGVEIPNHEMAVIYLKDIVTTDAFLNAPSELTLALGKDIGGAPYYAALEKMPHLLIAGTTGSGKSVCINSIIVSLLLRLGPDRLRMILIDPKMLELTVYNDVPHLVTSVVTEARDAARSLHWLTAEMERRYRHFAERGVRNLLSYNERYGSEEPLPYIVVVVDELADLMLTDAGEIEAPIARLAQMARAVGIHLILATQRPSVDVLTGVIKANFPARIAFQVASRVDSRTILDMNGAESLVGRGDMLYLPAGEPEPHRVHGAFVSDKETERVVSFLKRYRAGTPRIDIVSEALAGAGGATGEDPLFEEAARIVITHQQGSVSLLQRRLKVGYSRAARLMDMLEAQGIVGPPDGSKAREVLADLSTLDGMQGREDL
jgi:S-DNA-T family DNA segregation ATPase FtsK/SpoIIIE